MQVRSNIGSRDLQMRGVRDRFALMGRAAGTGAGEFCLKHRRWV